MTPLQRMTCAAVLIPQILGCPASPSAPAPSAEPARSPAASAPSATGSASGARPLPTHEPGTVPAPRRPPAAAPDAGAAPPPTGARLAAAKTRKAPPDLVGVSFVGKGGGLLVRRAAAVALVDVGSGAGVEVRGDPTGLAVSPDESLLAVGSGERVWVWTVATGALRNAFPAPAASLAFSPDGTKLAAGGEAVLAVHDAASGKELARATLELRPFDLTFAAQGKEIVASDGTLRVARIAADTGAALPGGGGAETGGTFGITLSPDGRFAAAAAPAGHGMQVFDVASWQGRTLVSVPEGSCLEHVFTTFAPSGRYLFAQGGKRWIKGFEVGSFKAYASFHAPPGRELAAAAGDLSRVVVTKAGGKDPAVVTVSNGAETRLAPPLSDEAFYTMSADGERVAGWAGDALVVWSARTGKVEYEERR